MGEAGARGQERESERERERESERERFVCIHSNGISLLLLSWEMWVKQRILTHRLRWGEQLGSIYLSVEVTCMRGRHLHGPKNILIKKE